MKLYIKYITARDILVLFMCYTNGTHDYARGLDGKKRKNPTKCSMCGLLTSLMCNYFVFLQCQHQCYSSLPLFSVHRFGYLDVEYCITVEYLIDIVSPESLARDEVVRC